MGLGDLRPAFYEKVANSVFNRPCHCKALSGHEPAVKHLTKFYDCQEDTAHCRLCRPFVTVACSSRLLQVCPRLRLHWLRHMVLVSSVFRDCETHAGQTGHPLR